LTNRSTYTEPNQKCFLSESQAPHLSQTKYYAASKGSIKSMLMNVRGSLLLCNGFIS